MTLYRSHYTLNVNMFCARSSSKRPPTSIYIESIKSTAKVVFSRKDYYRAVYILIYIAFFGFFLYKKANIVRLVISSRFLWPNFFFSRWLYMEMLREASGLKQDQKYSNDCPSIMKDIKFQQGRLSRFRTTLTNCIKRLF